MRLLDSSTCSKRPTRSILEVGVRAAFDELQEMSSGIGFETTAAVARGATYDWSRAPVQSLGGCASGGAIRDIEDM